MATAPTIQLTSLPFPQQVVIATNGTLTTFGVTPTAKTAFINAAIDRFNAMISSFSVLTAAGISFDSTINAETAASILKYLPPGYSVNTATYRQVLEVSQQVLVNLQQYKANPASIPNLVTVTAVPAPTFVAVSAPAPVSSNNTLSTVLGVGAAALGAIALVKAFTPQAAPAEVAPASDPAVNQYIPVDNEDIPIDQAQAEDFGGTDEAIAEQERIQSFEPAPTDEEIQAADIAMDEAIQAQQEADQDYAFSTGYDNVQDQKDAENQRALDQIEAEQIAADEQAVREADSELLRESRRGLTSEKAETQATANAQDATNFQAKEDWRVRLSLSPGANYLYKAKGAEGILLPLVATDGVIFPYTPNIVVVYAAHYEPTTLTHSNYKIFQYGSSSVDNVTITAEFTAQDTFEANYLLAVIHFFRSVTKMFYGNDTDPLNGTPPPLCYLSGLGEYQFDAHPLVITSFNYTLPTDVDYVRAGVGSAASPAKVNNISASTTRLGPNLTPGGLSAPPAFSSSTPYTKPTYVPTKMQISISAYPVVTRSDISNNFSLTKYATGELLQGTKRKGGGIW
jgi:hypothetical protein